MGFLNRSSDTSPLDGADAVFADLDGVVYQGLEAIPYAVEALNSIAVPLGYITNNASRSDETVAAHLRSLGLRTEANEVVTSPQAAMALLATVVAPGALVMVVGGDGIVSQLEAHGYRITRSADDNPDALLQGFAPEVGWKDLAEAAIALAATPGGPNPSLLPWIATNMDWTIPVARGIAPGNGTLVSAVHTAVGRMPLVAGKPEAPIFDEAKRRFRATNPIMIGDRLDTDILGANRAEIRSVHVLTGIDRAKQLLAAPVKSRPEYILADLRELTKPYPATETLRDGTVRVRSAKVRIDGITVTIIDPGNDKTDLLRAACKAIWASKFSIHALDVPESLYR